MRRRTGSSVAVGGGEVAAVVVMVTKSLQSSDSEAWSRGGETRGIGWARRKRVFQLALTFDYVD
jgi:hypothetical protein